ncbi:hypothetical protein [Sediminitomix flava]|uniref:Outer membrane beta-barrel protein n=1 Tax=Sediminitomix flava TaxID=379075 RepID=A0A315ZAT6_SEDFL|nr:hypothetical protein [Sediminitomix flava]PWJ42706.1 hypothetical protein BC781_102251 [Sediminitomix flava]
MRDFFTIRLLFTFFFISSSIPVFAQAIDQILEEDPLSISGGISLNQVAYTAFGDEDRRSPYTYVLNGNIAASLYGISIPISLSYSNQNFDYTYPQPFNQISLHPSYKNVRTHIGYVNMSFSPYTYQGYTFAGFGTEVTLNDHWDVKAFYGRFHKAIEYDSLNQNDNLVGSYKRNGFGTQINYQSGNNRYGFSLFSAKDEENSLQNSLDFIDVKPLSNIVLGVNISQSIAQKIFFQGEVALSSMNRDNRVTEEVSDNPFSFLGYRNTSATNLYVAFNTGLSYTGKGYVVGVRYERVAPEYETLGAYYFNNDLENITTNASVQLFEGKVSVSTNVGLQRDNIAETKHSDMERLVGSMNLGWQIHPKLQLSTSYSNFRTYTNVRPIDESFTTLSEYDVLDTLQFTQIAETANISSSWQIQTSKTLSKNLNVNFSWQQSSDEQPLIDSYTSTSMYNLNTVFGIRDRERNYAISFGANASLNQSPESNVKTYGPNCSFTKSFFERKLQTRYAMSWNGVETEGELTNQVMNFRSSANYSLKEKHNFQLSGVLVSRNVKNSNDQTASEFTVTLTYAYNFGATLIEKKEK